MKRLWLQNLGSRRWVVVLWQQAFLGIGPQLGGGREADNFGELASSLLVQPSVFHHGRGCSTSAIRWSLRHCGGTC